jgi:hypothetical protein
MATPNDELNKARKTTKEFAKDLSLVQDAFANIAQAIKEGLEDAIDSAQGLDDIGKKVQKSFGSELVSGLKKLTTSLDAQVNLQEKLNKGQNISKELAKERQRAATLENSIRQRILILAQNDVDLQEKLVKELDTQLNIQNKILDDLEAQNKAQEANLGIVGKLGKGLSGILNTFDKSGNLSSILDIDGAIAKSNRFANVMGKRQGSPVSSIKQAGYFAKQLGANLLSSIKAVDPLTLALQQTVQAAMKLDTMSGDTAKSFNMSYSEAVALNGELNRTANLSGDIAVNTKGLNESLIAVGNSLGSNAKLNEQDLVTFTKLREQAGFTNDELVGIQKLSLAQGKSLEDNTEAILGGAEAYASQNKLLLNEKTILRDVSKASASLKLSLGGSADALARSAAQARQFGLSLEQTEKIASSLLDFESSISSELEAELLTGKDLNLEQARLLALNGDTAAAAAEVAKQVGTSADFGKMNVIQQEAIAKAAGMTRDELAQSLIEREALTALSGVEGKNAKERFDNLVKEVGLEEAKKRLGNEQLATQFEQQSVQERFNQSILKLQELFVGLAEPVLAILDPLMQIGQTFLPLINVVSQPVLSVLKSIAEVVKVGISQPLEGLKGTFRGIMTILNGDVIEGFKQIGTSLLNIFLTPFQAITSGAVKLINEFIAIANKIPGVDIGEMQTPNLTNAIAGEGAMAFAEGGIVTKPVKGLVGEAGPEAIIPLDRLMTEFREMRAILTQIANKEGSVFLDGTKVGTAMAMSTYKTQ